MPSALEALTAWIDRYRLVHEQQFRRLDGLLPTITATTTPIPEETQP